MKRPRVVDKYKELSALYPIILSAREHRCWDGKKIGHYHLRLSEAAPQNLVSLSTDLARPLRRVDRMTSAFGP